MNSLAQYPVQASGPRLDNRRIAAGVVDLAVVAAVGLVLRAAAGGEFTAPIAAVTVAWGLFYYFVAESNWQQTLGKRLLGLRVQAQGGGVPDDRAIAMRTVLRIVDGIAFYLVGLLVMLRTGERRQRLGDIVGGTQIVDAREPVKAVVKSTLNAREVGAPEAAAEPEPAHSFEPVAELADEQDEPRIEIVTEPAEEEITVKPVETVSPMDLVMGENEPEQEQAGERSRAGSRDN